MTSETRTAREVYAAYLRGEATTEEIDRRAREINEARKSKSTPSEGGAS